MIVKAVALYTELRLSESQLTFSAVDRYITVNEYASRVIFICALWAGSALVQLRVFIVCLTKTQCGLVISFDGYS